MGSETVLEILNDFSKTVKKKGKIKIAHADDDIKTTSRASVSHTLSFQTRRTGIIPFCRMLTLNYENVGYGRITIITQNSGHDGTNVWFLSSSRKGVKSMTSSSRKSSLRGVWTWLALHLKSTPETRPAPRPTLTSRAPSHHFLRGQ